VRTDNQPRPTAGRTCRPVDSGAATGSASTSGGTARGKRKAAAKSQPNLGTPESLPSPEGRQGAVGNPDRVVGRSDGLTEVVSLPTARPILPCEAPTKPPKPEAPVWGPGRLRWVNQAVIGSPLGRIRSREERHGPGDSRRAEGPWPAAAGSPDGDSHDETPVRGRRGKKRVRTEYRTGLHQNPTARGWLSPTSPDPLLKNP